jgi:hypothetical protein
MSGGPDAYEREVLAKRRLEMQNQVVSLSLTVSHSQPSFPSFLPLLAFPFLSRRSTTNHDSSPHHTLL